MSHGVRDQGLLYWDVNFISFDQNADRQMLISALFDSTLRETKSSALRQFSRLKYIKGNMGYLLGVVAAGIAFFLHDRWSTWLWFYVFLFPPLTMVPVIGLMLSKTSEWATGVRHGMYQSMEERDCLIKDALTDSKRRLAANAYLVLCEVVHAAAIYLPIVLVFLPFKIK